jgi:hypothetical protein
MKVLFIAGADRSGSTLLSCVLDHFPGVSSIGELHLAWIRGLIENQLCGCGEPFRACPFWQAVCTEALGDPATFDAAGFQRLHRSVTRYRYIGQLGLGLPAGARHLERRKRYADALRAVLSAVGRHSGASVVVDSSKDPRFGFLLSSVPGVELYTLHLVRDSRAVAWSWQRQRLRPEIHWQQECMPRLGTVKSTVFWSVPNILARLMRRRSAGYMALRYEDFVAQPRQYTERILDFVGVAAPSAELLDRALTERKVTHTVSGNPMRFDQGQLRIKPDTEWVEAMPAASRRAVTLLTWPLLLRYRYPLRGPARRD